MSKNRRIELERKANSQVERLDFSLRAKSSRELLESAEGDVDWDRSWHFFAHSYSRAFEVVWDAEYAGRKEVFKYPLLSITRHSIELWLKAAFSAVTMTPPSPGHGLNDLWDKLMDALAEHMGSELDEPYSDAVRHLINTLDSHDGHADRFRYPTNRNSSKYMSSNVDLDELYRAHSLITGFCGAVCMQMQAELYYHDQALC